MVVGRLPNDVCSRHLGGLSVIGGMVDGAVKVGRREVAGPTQLIWLPKIALAKEIFLKKHVFLYMCLC